MKLVVAEEETAALRAWLSAEERSPVSCDLSRTELMRAVRRAAPDRVRQARAGRLGPTILRTLDALHLAAALDLGDDLQAIVTYDERLADAARSNGVAVLAPS